jgi:hypothetical protein
VERRGKFQGVYPRIGGKPEIKTKKSQEPKPL